MPRRRPGEAGTAQLADWPADAGMKLVSGQVMQRGCPHYEQGDHRYDDYRDDHVPQAFPGISIVTSHAARLARLTCAGANCRR